MYSNFCLYLVQFPCGEKFLRVNIGYLQRRLIIVNQGIRVILRKLIIHETYLLFLFFLFFAGKLLQWLEYINMENKIHQLVGNLVFGYIIKEKPVKPVKK